MQQEKVKKFHLLVWEAIVLIPYGKNVSVHYSLPVLCISFQASREVEDILYLFSLRISPHRRSRAHTADDGHLHRNPNSLTPQIQPDAL